MVKEVALWMEVKAVVVSEVTDSVEAAGNAGLGGDPSQEGGNEDKSKESEKAKSSSAERKVKWRKKRANVEKESATKREKHKAVALEKQKTTDAERKAEWRKKEANVEKESATKREKRKAVALEKPKKKPASSAERRAESRNKEGMLEKEMAKQREKRQLDSKKKEAAKLERQASFSMGQEKPDISFEDFERNPEAAVLLYLLNSGNNKFPDLEDLDFDVDSDEWDPVVVERLLEEIREEVPTGEELCEMLKKYCTAQGRGGIDGVNHQVEGLPKTVDCAILSCGSCGIRRPQRGTEKLAKVMLRELVGSAIEYNAIDKEAWIAEKGLVPLCLPCNAAGDVKPFDTSKLRSVYDSILLQTTFHLHPEMVLKQRDEEGTLEEYTFVCSKCAECKGNSSKKPSNSIAAGLDLGDFERIGLVEPSVSELCLIARVRNYLNCVKVSDNKKAGCLTNYTVSKIRGHAIAFRHTAPIVGSLAMLLNQVQQGEKDRSTVAELLTESLTVHLLGSKGDEDAIARTAQKVLGARPFVVYQWLSVLQRVNSRYQDDPQLPDFSEFAVHVEACNKAVFDNAEHVRDRETLNAERAMGDDVAHVRSGIVEGTCEEAAGESREDNDPALLHSYVVDENQQVNNLGPELRQRDNAERAAESIEAMASAFNVDVSKTMEAWREGAEAQWAAEREEDPLSEFEDAEELLAGSYPHVFMYGKAFADNAKQKPSGGAGATPIDKKQIEHLLLQYTARAARSQQLLYYLFDHEMRHSFMKNLSIRIKKNPSSFYEFAELLSSEEWKEKILVAGNNPTSKVAKEVLSTVIPVLNFGNGDRNIMGSIGDASSFSHAIAMMHRFGSASCFLTITPNDVSNPTSFRLCHRSCGNERFPASCPPEFLEALHNDDAVFDAPATEAGATIPIPINYTARVRAAAGNPIAVAMEYQALIENVMEHLIGCPIELRQSDYCATKKSWYFRGTEAKNPRKKGCFGYVTGFHGMTETQQVSVLCGIGCSGFPVPSLTALGF